MADPASVALLQSVHESAGSLRRQHVDPLGEKLLFHVPHPAGNQHDRPMVLIIGNHSSGKSSLINHMLGRAVQKTGVAPTDDGFTVMVGGPRDEDKDGPAMVGTPGLGLGELERFGTGLTAHIRLKVLSGSPILDELCLVDSPGMIDATVDGNQRGYDFLGVVKWLANRADVVALLFDPDKPGTTSETLQALTSSLADLEHKLVIVFNKVDQFESVHDFARAYGALCWNLAKVIRRKDLPRIHNCFVPGPGRPRPTCPIPTAEFETGLAEVLSEFRRAPQRRIDNLVSHLATHTQQLSIHARVMDRIGREHRAARWAWRLRAVGAGTGVMLLAALFHALGVSTGRVALTVVAGLAVTSALIAWGRHAALERAQELADDLESVFRKLYQNALAAADSGSLLPQWEAVRTRILTALQTLGLENLPRVTAAQLTALDEISTVKIPALRSDIYAKLQQPRT